MVYIFTRSAKVTVAPRYEYHVDSLGEEHSEACLHLLCFPGMSREKVHEGETLLALVWDRNPYKTTLPYLTPLRSLESRELVAVEAPSFPSS